jgi:hypothetical protein
LKTYRLVCINIPIGMFYSVAPRRGKPEEGDRV